jgi:hypothetical protein
MIKKKVNIIMGPPTVNGFGVTGVFYCRQRLHVNSASQFTLHDLEAAETGTVSRTCNSYLALYKPELQRELLPAAAFSKNLLKAQVRVK